MPSSFKKALITVLLALLEAAKFLGLALFILFRALVWPFVMLWRYVLRPIVFLGYRLFIRLRTVTGTMFAPIRSTIMAVLGHRYVVHATMILIVLFVSTKSLYARQTDLGQASKGSIVYELAQKYGNEVEQGTDNIDISGTDYGLFSATSTDEIFSYDQTGVTKPFPTPPGEAEPPRIAISKPEKYVVGSGDTLGAIARKYGISINTILWANGMTARSLLRIGQSLTILPVDGILHTVVRGETVSGIAKKFGTDVDKILRANRVTSANEIHVGESLIIPDGKPPAQPAPKKAPATLGSIKNVFKSSSEAPQSAAQISGSRNLAWPTASHHINQYFHYGHPGVDIHGVLQDPIYAVDDGIVTTSGWNSGGYGNMILIDHGNGMVTRYGHASVLFVHSGDQVTKGQTIGMVGSTGHSTGPHVHFEVYLNGRRYNPLQFYK